MKPSGLVQMFFLTNEMPAVSFPASIKVPTAQPEMNSMARHARGDIRDISILEAVDTRSEYVASKLYERIQQMKCKLDISKINQH